IRQIADLVDDEHVRRYVADERVGELVVVRRDGQVFDELGGGDEERVKSVLDGAIADGDCEVRLAAAWFAMEDEVASVGDKIRRERRAEERELDRALVGKIEIVDGLEKREATPLCVALDARLRAMRHLFADHRREKVVIAPLLRFCASDEVAPRATRV